jgi:hypothetical protein
MPHLDKMYLKQDPDFYRSRIPDHTTATKEEGKKFSCPSQLNKEL